MCALGRIILREMHEGIYEAYFGTNALIRKIMWYGYFSPSIWDDAKEMVWPATNVKYIQTTPQNEYQCMGSPIPFAQWRINLLGQFPKAPRKERILDGGHRLFHPVGQSQGPKYHHIKISSRFLLGSRHLKIRDPKNSNNRKREIIRLQNL